MADCAKCGATIAEGTAFCGACGAAAGGGAAAPAVATESSGLSQNVAGMLAYFTILPAILFLVLEPYNKNRFIRFHAFQSLFFGIAWIVLSFAGTFITSILAFVPAVGWMLGLLFWLVVGLGAFVLWIYLIFKAYNNQKVVLPLIGKLAEEQAAK